MPPREDLRAWFQDLRAREFARLDDEGQAYLDYTGSGLYAASQLRAHEELLRCRVLGNPHSENPASAAATRLVEETRRRVLDFFRADPDEYVVVFTANASAALKLVGEAFPFDASSRFTLPADNHNSVHGIRRYAETAGAEVDYLALRPDLRLASGDLPPAGDGPSLFAFPGQSNFSGVRHPLSLVDRAREAGYRVLLDAAAFAPTNVLDLSEVRPDYAAVAFYKMFGYPTGVGALLARRTALAELKRPWFAGGTVEFVSVQSRVHRLRVDAEAFEDGTPNFLGIAAVAAGLDFLAQVGMDRVHARVEMLTGRLLEILRAARHPGGAPAVRVYGPVETRDRGATVAFNLLDSEGRIVPFGEVERLASDRGIALRGGCFCNPGAAEVALEMPADRTLSCLERQERGAFSLRALADCLDGTAVGAMRASLGIATTEEDLDRLAAFLEAEAGRFTKEAPGTAAGTGGVQEESAGAR